MGAPQEVIQEVFTVIEGGNVLGETAQIIQFPTDNGQSVYNVVEKTYQGTNGTGFNYWVVAFETLVGETMMAVSAGAAMLTMEVSAAAMAAAPALGIATGYTLYNLTPEFWDNLADALIDAGETVNGKVVAFMNENGILTFSRNAIEIIKNGFLDAGLFEVANMPEYSATGELEITEVLSPFELFKYGMSKSLPYVFEGDTYSRLLSYFNTYSDYIPLMVVRVIGGSSWLSGTGPFMQLMEKADSITLPDYTRNPCLISLRSRSDGTTIFVEDVYFNYNANWGIGTFIGESIIDRSARISGINGEWLNNEAVQTGAKLPDENPFTTTYPSWLPWEFPIIDPTGTPQQLPDRFPIEYPDLLPEIEPYQDPAQNPDPAVENNPEKVEKTLEDPQLDPNSPPSEAPVEDPEGNPEGEPIDNPTEGTETPEDPINPDPPGPITPVIPVPLLPDTVDSNKLFTVYNPSSSQLDALGGYLWDNDLIDILRKIWQNPLDGIISLIQVYATPSTGASRNIILGYLDSGVSAPVVSNQFVTIDCGTITVDELSENCLDYIPYTKLELYLPFIGVTEIDTNEFMDGTINVKYKVDVYTGTCLAEVKCTRNRDLANGTILYTFNGNCSQQIPLTSGDARGVLSALIGAAGLGLSIASGGASAITGAGLLKTGARVAGELGSVASQEMLHVSHSGNLSANAGIMGQKKPYLIINRKRPYTANEYNKYYGFPANKTIYPGNYEGFVRLKAGRLKSAATEAEKSEIYELLTHGVIM